jgi:broad specificity phosphatase PhoE
MVGFMGIEVLIVQHGEKVRAAGDPGLTETGVRQAAAVAAWLAKNRTEVSAVWASPLRRAQQTAAPIAAAFGLAVQTDARLRERMNWDDESEIGLDGFLAEWQRASRDRTYRPTVGDSSSDAAERFVAALVAIGRTTRKGTVVVVAHGGVTVDSLRTVAGEAAVNNASADLVENGLPCGAITRLQVDGEVVSVNGYPSTSHLDEITPHRPA